MAKKILVACGTGIATSTMASDKIQKELDKRGVGSGIIINQCKVAEVPSMANNYDLIVSTTQVSSSVERPVISGLAFLTGIGLDKVVDEIIEKLGL